MVNELQMIFISTFTKTWNKYITSQASDLRESVASLKRPVN